MGFAFTKVCEAATRKVIALDLFVCWCAGFAIEVYVEHPVELA